MTYSFTIYGNHEDPYGNPVPFQRVIKQQMRSAAARYLAWMKYVRNSFVSQNTHPDLVMAAMQNRPPIELAKGQRFGIEIKVFWANQAHGDLDNVLKGILDALFKNDKGLNALKASAEVAENGRGRVEVFINVSD